MDQTFTPGEAIKTGWETMKKNFWFFVGLLIVSGLVEVIPTSIANIFKSRMFVLYFILIIAAWVIQAIVKMGLIKITLDVLDKGKGEMGDLFSRADRFINFILGAILYALIVIGGLILLIVPGIIWAIKYQYFSYLIVDKNMKPMEAIRKSGEITMGNKGNLFVLGLLLCLINLAGLLCLLIGLFATVPLTMVATAYVYRKLMGEIAEPSISPQPAEPATTAGQIA
jgi:uncharacterized membrane protein